MIVSKNASSVVEMHRSFKKKKKKIYLEITPCTNFSVELRLILFVYFKTV